MLASLKSERRMSRRQLASGRCRGIPPDKCGIPLVLVLPQSHESDLIKVLSTPRACTRTTAALDSTTWRIQDVVNKQHHRKTQQHTPALPNRSCQAQSLGRLLASARVCNPATIPLHPINPRTLSSTWLPSPAQSCDGQMDPRTRTACACPRCMTGACQTCRRQTQQ